MKSSTEFFLRDYPQTLFPLRLNRLLVEKYSTELQTYTSERARSGGESFQTQHPVFASKRGWFLRRTVKLDPAAEFFLYDLVYRYRARFSRRPAAGREVFGFRIVGGEPISGVKAYGEFKTRTAGLRRAYRFHAYMDVACYFNHIYHHDLVAWFEQIGGTPDDVCSFGKFLRETAGGRTVDCLPQGIYPGKMIGAAFLSFVEDSPQIKSRHSVRLMDDIWLFDPDRDVVVSDFLTLQNLLGKRGLSINDRKSAVLEGSEAENEIPADLDEMKRHLLTRRRATLSKSDPYGDADEDDQDDDDDAEEGDAGRGESANDLGELTAEEHSYLIGLLSGDSIQEEDAELVLTLMREQSADVLEHLSTLLREFPALIKRIYHYCAGVADKTEIAAAVLNLLKSPGRVTEYQLFWLGMMAEDYLLDTPQAGEILMSLFDHGSATDISRAKILEIPELRYGMRDLRLEHTRTGASDWPAWAAAVGSRSDPKGQRNQSLKYFRAASSMNRLVGDFVESCF